MSCCGETLRVGGVLERAIGSSFGGALRNEKVLQACHVCLDASLPDVTGVKGHVLTCSPSTPFAPPQWRDLPIPCQDQSGVKPPEQA